MRVGGRTKEQERPYSEFRQVQESLLGGRFASGMARVSCLLALSLLSLLGDSSPIKARSTHSIYNKGILVQIQSSKMNMQKMNIALAALACQMGVSMAVTLD